MKNKIVIDLNDKSDMWLYGNDDRIYHIKEGTGDALEQGDIDDGYIDYIYIDIYENLEGVNQDASDDGGIILLSKYYKDLEQENIIDRVADFFGVNFDIE